MDLTILAIESSCDETAAAVIKNSKILSNVVATQSVHEAFGGVVPELASRAHQQNIVPVVKKALHDANITKADLSTVAYTKGPGLLGSLLVGASFAKSLAMGLSIPLIEVHHMQAHILSHFIDDPIPQFPFLCLTVSGGHTQIVQVSDYLDMEILGETQDDAVGEAFDKAAKLLGFPYPGGPQIDHYGKTGDLYRYQFPPAQMEGLDFSFSGIKTAFLYFLREAIRSDSTFVEKNMADICASIQHCLVQMLVDKLILATDRTGVNQVAIAGGVAANSYLRKRLEELSVSHGWRIFIPKFEYCTDNAAMIAMTAHFKFRAGQFADLKSSPDPRYRF